MDIVIVLIVFCVGWVRLSSGEMITPNECVVVNDYTEEVYDTYEDLPIGTNLMLKREPDAFYRIEKELNLL